MTVYFNGRRAVHKGCGGVLTTIDPCYDANGTVVDYVNIAKTDDAANCSTRVTVDGFPLCHKQSYFAKSTGDEAGVGGGVRYWAENTNGGPEGLGVRLLFTLLFPK